MLMLTTSSFRQCPFAVTLSLQSLGARECDHGLVSTCVLQKWLTMVGLGR